MPQAAKDQGKLCDWLRAWRPWDLEIFTGAAIEVILSISIWGARLRWAARADDEPTATEGGDPSDTYKRWFGRVSGRVGWWRGSSLVGTSYRPGCHRRMRAGSSPRARPGPTDGRSDAVATRTTLSP
jgi:hypothetical protein